MQADDALEGVEQHELDQQRYAAKYVQYPGQWQAGPRQQCPQQAKQQAGQGAQQDRPRGKLQRDPGPVEQEQQVVNGEAGFKHDEPSITKDTKKEQAPGQKQGKPDDKNRDKVKQNSLEVEGVDCTKVLDVERQEERRGGKKE